MLKFFRGFGFALNGIILAFKTQLNFKVQLICAIMVLCLSCWLGIRKWEWVAIIFCIGLVLTVEAINTSIEELTNHVSPEIHPQAGKVKDLSAAAVLIVSLTSLVVALVIFIPRIIHLFSWYAG